MNGLIGTLKVSPEEMLAAAAELSGYISNMRDCFETMKNTMVRSVNYWVGEAGEAHRQLYLEQVDQTEEMIARYTEHVTDLNAMAGVYSEAEQSAQNVAEELPASNL